MKDIYLDGASNTPLDTNVLAVMKPFLSHTFVGNSMSIHGFGIRADQVIIQARETIKDCLKAREHDVYFTSGATEGNNWAIKSVVYQQLRLGRKGHIICSATEHESVLKCCQQIESIGFPVSYVHPSNHISVTQSDIEPLIRDDTCLICVMAINNETGAANDVTNILSLAERHHINTLVDCTQLISYGGSYIELCERFPTASFMTFSAHKIYGPLGVGCLIARSDCRLEPLIIGGSQERGLRGGTMNTAGIIGAAQAIKDMHNNPLEGLYKDLYQYLVDSISSLPGVYLNVIPEHKNIISLNCSKYINTDKLAAELSLYGVAVSAGSACDSQHNETQGDFKGSHVLVELGLSELEIRNTVRVSFTKYNTMKDIDKLIKTLKEIKQLCK